MGSYYSKYVSNRDPLDDCYDWPITGVPGTQLREDGFVNPVTEEHMDERWKETPLGNIWVSNEGRFYNAATDHLIKPTHGDGHGHLAVKTRVQGKQKQAYAARLIANAFIDNVHNDPVVRHLDDDPSNNELENLAWGTQHENHLDCVRNGTYRGVTDEDRRKGIEITRHPVLATNLTTGEELYFESQGDAGRKLGVSQRNISNIIRGGYGRHSAGGYSFREISREEESQYK